VSAINKLTDSDRESINKLSNSILKDYALTNKILRLVNSAFYRQVGGGNISTVSRAVIVLGFDAVRNIAITVLLFEHLENKGNAKDLKEGFLRANLAGLLARDASQKFMAREAEEAYICALFHRLGQLLAQYYFPDEFEEVRKLMQTRKLSENAAGIQILGLTFEEIGTGIARTWGFPDSIVNAMRRLPEGKIRRPVTMEQQLHVVAGFANEICDTIASCTAESLRKTLSTVMERFSSSMLISEKQIRETVEQSFDELAELSQILHVNLKQSPFARQVQIFTGRGPTTPPAVAGLDSEMAGAVLGDTTVIGLIDGHGGAEDAPEAIPEDAQSVLTAGIQDISNSLVDDFSLNDLLRIILETMYRAMGFQRVLLCLKDAKTGLMMGRFGFGPDAAELAKRFRFSLAFESDVFHLALQKAVDIIITDIDDPKIADRIPSWYREKMSARTFVLFPLTIKGNPVALIYCDKDKAGSIQIPEKELTLLKTLRNQALLAIKQAA
jgi:HD-like signal output (HDOD) protein